MTKCTDPQQWVAAPRSDAPEEDVARYLAHLEECAFHAAIEQRETAQLRTLLNFGVSEPGRPSPEPQGPEAEALRENLERLGAIRHGAFIRALSIRVDGSERCRLDLREANRVTLEVEKGALVGVWQPEQAGEAEELYLTTHVLRTDNAGPRAKSVSSTVLEGGQKISFTVEPGAGSRCQLTVAYVETHWLRWLRLSLARLKHKLARRARELYRIPALKLTAGLLALLAVLGLLSFLLLRTDSPTQTVRQEETPPPVAPPAIVEPVTAPQTAAPPSPNINSEMPSPTRRNTVAVERARPQMSLAKVRRVYVGMGEGEYLQRLRAAVIAELQESGRFKVVAREQEADAVLLNELTRSASVRVQLLNRDGKALWFTTQATTGESTENVSEDAAMIVRKLSDAAKER